MYRLCIFIDLQNGLCCTSTSILTPVPLLVKRCAYICSKQPPVILYASTPWCLFSCVGLLRGPLLNSMAYLCTTTAMQSCCHTPGHPVLHIRRPMRSFALASRLQAQNQRCRRGSNIVTAQQSSSGSAQLARQPQQPAIVLSRNQLANKQVVTRTDGQILGVVDHLLANSNTFRVDALSCKPSSDMLAGDEPKQIGLVSLKQISDVLLVHDRRALLRPAEICTIGLGYVKLIGTVVKTAEGKVIGKVMPLSSMKAVKRGYMQETVTPALQQCPLLHCMQFGQILTP